jgi:D-alanyl-D-alanine carboxypeptidase (penicillin-binding protein 5/6)
MTAYLTLRRAPLGRLVVVPPAATRIGESTVDLRAGRRLPVRLLLSALLVPSANDAAETLAYAVAGSEPPFVAEMNRTAASLGMRDTRYRAPYGLDVPGQFSSPYDSVLIARRLMDDLRFRRLVLQRSIRVAARRYVATNRLLDRYPGDDGVKTGHTDEAGWCLVGTAVQNGRRMYAAAFGARDADARDLAVRRLLDWAFARYRRVVVVRRGVPLATLPVPYGGTLDVVTGGALSRVLRSDRRLSTDLVLPDQVTPPVRRGDAVGAVVVRVDGRVVGRVPAVATRDVARPSLLRRGRWLLRRARETVLHPSRWF